MKEKKEHRLYYVGEDLLLCTPKRATMYRLKGLEVFDLTASLDMEPNYIEEDYEYIYYS